VRNSRHSPSLLPLWLFVIILDRSKLFLLFIIVIHSLVVSINIPQVLVTAVLHAFGVCWGNCFPSLAYAILDLVFFVRVGTFFLIGEFFFWIRRLSCLSQNIQHRRLLSQLIKSIWFKRTWCTPILINIVNQRILRQPSLQLLNMLSHLPHHTLLLNYLVL